jgi:hypothetical protein
MTLQEPTAEGVRYLLGLLDQPAAERVCERLDITPDGAVGPSADRVSSWQVRQVVQGLHGSVVAWMLQEDTPDGRTLLAYYHRLPIGLRRDVDAIEAENDWSAEKLVAALRRAEGPGTLKDARAAVGWVRAVHWPALMKAHDEQPLPGFARWALSERIDCPPVLRAAFGDHPKFRHRLRQAGIYESPVHYLHEAPLGAAQLLRVLGLGRTVFPAHLAEAEAVLGPLVRAQLGADSEAWAVLAQLLPGFAGSLTELLTTAGAIAGPSAAA